ncbi:unnamed protein product [Hermetia illucens]|uniref:Peptidase S1 domain-containing protein n=1 Tax=Hermetia illucens TaxID=343691 RepID=A0A7R8YXV9_HERIL|nr:trypsin beta-like [Hermetia illucens]CAD7089403.1 unnamed protein product [Hermetia illucens]
MSRLTIVSFIIISIGIVSAGVIPDGLYRMENRIIGGYETTVDHFPYQISIRFLGSHRCGASLIQPNFILTAAHCVYGATTLFLRFVAGSSFRNSGGESLYVGKVIIHEDYEPSTGTNDVAVVRMDGFYEYTNLIQPIALASKAQRFRIGTKAVVSGWGTEEEGASVIPVQLRYTYVYGFDFDECAEAYTEINPVVPGMICAFYPGGGKDACQGDSGGPMVVGDKQIGIVSWGQGCARAEYPGVYTDVAYYRDWIEKSLLL